MNNETIPQWKDHERIYLQPMCGRADCQKTTYLGEGRQWCEDPQEPCEECGKEWIPFNRAKIAELENGNDA